MFLQYICEHQFQRLSNRSLFTGLKARTHFGRIDFDQYFANVQKQHPEVKQYTNPLCIAGTNNYVSHIVFVGKQNWSF